MIRTFIRGVLGALVVALASCGGGSNTCNNVTGGNACDDNTGVGAPADLRIALDAVSMENSPASRVTATITAVDAGNAVVANAPVSVKVDTDAEVIVSSITTDSAGKLTAVVSVGPNRSDRIITLTAQVTGTTISRTATIGVVGAKLSGTATAGIVTPGQQGTVNFKLVDTASNAIVGEAIVVTAPGLATGEGVTDSAGTYKYTFTAPSTIGNLTITGAAAGAAPATVTVNVQPDSSSIDPPSGTVLSATVSANPSVVTVNTPNSTAQGTAVRALFVGANNARIKNVRVRFDLPDPNRVGGTVESGSNVLYSNDSGFAETTYHPGTVPSPTNGVTVRACWASTDAALAGGACPNVAEVKLTVVSDALRVTIGTDELVGLSTGTYTKEFAILVLDAAGRAKADVQITPTVDLLGFYKGYYVFDPVQDLWVQIVTTQDGPYSWTGTGWVDDGNTATRGVCPNEDSNRNGVREDGEDLNGNGELDPAGVTITTVGTGSTDSNGKAIVRIEYSRDRATWIDYRITITATVAGSEGKAVYTGTRYGLGNLPAPGTAVSNENVFPAFGISPYGRGNDALSGANSSRCDNTR